MKLSGTKWLYIISALLISVLYSGCDQLTDLDPVNSDLADIDGFWQVCEYLDDQGEETYRYYVVDASAETITIWSDWGLGEKFEILENSQNPIKVETLINTNNPEYVGTQHQITWSLEGGNLTFEHGPLEGDNWQWGVKMTRITTLPSFSYSLDFEDNAPGFFESNNESISADEWEVVTDGTDKVYAPTHSDGNSDSYLNIAPGDNFSLEYRAKRFADSSSSCWSVVEFDHLVNAGDSSNSYWFNSHGVNTFYFGDRGEEIIDQPYSSLLNWEEWHDFKITVTDGVLYQFFIDGSLIGEKTVPYEFIKSLKLEGNPTSGKWYIDDFLLSWNIENSPAAPDFNNLSLLSSKIGNIVALSPDGSSIYQLTSSGYSDWMPHWFPNGEEILFIRNIDEVPTIVHLDLLTMKESIMDLGAGKYSSLDISPDGTKVVFESNRDNVADANTTNDNLTDIYLMNADGTNIVNLTNSLDFDEKDPSFSNDGTQITYVSGENHSLLAYQVMTMNIDGSNQTVITPDTGIWNTNSFEAAEPRFSSDDSTIVFHTKVFTDATHISSLYSVAANAIGSDADASDDPVLLYGDALEGASSPTYNPDSSKIYFQCDGAIWNMNADGTGAVKLLNRPDGNWYYNFDFLK